MKQFNAQETVSKISELVYQNNKEKFPLGFDFNFSWSEVSHTKTFYFGITLRDKSVIHKRTFEVDLNTTIEKFWNGTEERCIRYFVTEFQELIDNLT
jgi:hypothetical protein